MAEIELSVSQAITRLKNRDTSILFIFKSYSWKFLLEIFSFLFAFSIFLCCRFSLKVHASGSQARQETAKRAMNGTYSQTGDAATPPVVCNAKKMQCQQQKQQWQRRRQEKSVKIMQFMRYTWQEEQRFLAGTRTQGLTKVHRQGERKREGGSNTLGASCFACCVAVPPSPLSLSFIPSAAAHLIFGNINLLTTYTTCCAAMRRFCCFCHVFSPPLSLCLLAIGQLQLQQLLLCMLQALHPKLAQLLLLLLLLTKCIRFRTDSAVR